MAVNTCAHERGLQYDKSHAQKWVSCFHPNGLAFQLSTTIPPTNIPHGSKKLYKSNDLKDFYVHDKQENKRQPPVMMVHHDRSATAPEEPTNYKQPLKSPTRGS